MGVIVLVFGLMVLLFQNCSNVRFVAVSSKLEALMHAKILEIPVTGQVTNSYENLNLVIILDDSTSMAQEISKVKVALDEFLKKLSPQQALTTSVYGINHLYLPQKFIKYDADGNELPQNTPAQVVAKEKQVFSLLEPAAKLVTTPDTSAEEFTTGKNKFFADLNSYLEQRAIEQSYTENTNEAGLCTLVRYLHDENLSKGNDKLSFLIISDEDDSTLKTNCVNFDYVTYEPLARLNFKGSIFNANVEVTGIRNSDGGAVLQITKEKRTLSFTCDKDLDFCRTIGQDLACSPEVINHFSQGHFYNLATLTSMDSCKMTIETGVDQLSYLYKSMVEDITKACSGVVKIVDGASHDNFKEYLSDRYGVYLNPNATCTFDVTRMNSNSDITYYQEFSDLMAAPDRIREFALNKYGSKNIAINVVIYDQSDAGCLVSAGSSGAKYAQLVKEDNAFFKKHSICSAQYDAVLAETNNLINWDPENVYDLVVEADHEVLAVEILELSGKRTMLSENEYLINARKLSVNKDVLPMNSVINIYYDKIKRSNVY